jgi:hypothetical protein
MKKIILFLALIIPFISSCKRSGVSSYELPNVKKEIINNHDMDSWYELHETNEDIENLPYDLIMLKDSKDNGVACYKFYDDYIRTLNKGKSDKDYISKLDKPEREFLIYILQKGALKGDDYCREYLYYFFTHGVGVDKNPLKADSLRKLYPPGQLDCQIISLK